jgi:hypothetical protein
MTTANAALTSLLPERVAASETVEMAEANSLMILCDCSARMRLSPETRRSDVTYSLKIPSSVLLDREAKVLQHTGLAQQLTFLSRPIRRGTAFQRASADPDTVRQTSMSSLDNLAVGGTQLLHFLDERAADSHKP